MIFEEAMKRVGQGETVQSLVSFTNYSMSGDFDFLAEGEVVDPLKYLTEAEVSGEWREVEIIEKREDFEKLSADEKSQLLDEAMVHFDYHENKIDK